jgi:hypothetical protein
MIRVIGIKITDRLKEIGLTQEILSRHASIITTRLGFHELTNEVCSREACIILHVSGNPTEAERMMKDLRTIGGIEIRDMNFTEKNQPGQGKEEGNIRIYGLLVEQDHHLVVAVQKLLTSYGCVIRTRLGVNEKFFGKPAGLIILELEGDLSQMKNLEKDIVSLKKVHFRKMIF